MRFHFLLRLAKIKKVHNTLGCKYGRKKALSYILVRAWEHDLYEGQFIDRLQHFILFFNFFWLHRAAFGLLVPQPGIEPVPPALEVQSLNHWTAREVPTSTF